MLSLAATAGTVSGPWLPLFGARLPPPGFCLPKSIPIPVHQTQGTPTCAALDAKPKSRGRAKTVGKEARLCCLFQEVLSESQHLLLHSEGVHQ